jgi:hypothetical protein
MAFKTGDYNGFGLSGKYGDLGAAVAATLMDREARSLTLAADPTHGQIREPILRLMHFLRAMEFHPREYKEVELNSELNLQMGQVNLQMVSCSVTLTPCLNVISRVFTNLRRCFRFSDLTTHQRGQCKM